MVSKWYLMFARVSHLVTGFIGTINSENVPLCYVMSVMKSE